MKDRTNIDAVIDQLYHKESGNLIAQLTRLFSSNNIELAEEARDNPIFDDIPTRIEVHPIMPVAES